MNRELLTEEVQKFIKDHENHDPFAFLLKHKTVMGIPAAEVVRQIQSRSKSRNKLPLWHQTEGIYFPPPVSIEQCSSEKTARYKASLVSGRRLTDLTGGAGVDAFYFSKSFTEVDYVEKNTELAEVAFYNFTVLNAPNISVHPGAAEEYIERARESDVIYADPSRRVGQKVFLLRDSEPDIQSLLPRLFGKTGKILLKLSPLMDIDAAVKELPNVAQIHVVSLDNECKETLYLLEKNFEGEPEIHAINLKKEGQDRFVFLRSGEASAAPVFGEVGTYLYEPNASILKAGAFRILSPTYHVRKLHMHSHLYTSERQADEFPGKTFTVRDLTLFNIKKAAQMTDKGAAHIVARNFPLSVAQIRAKTGIMEGGDDFLFFTTDWKNRKIVIRAERNA